MEQQKQNLQAPERKGQKRKLEDATRAAPAAEEEEGLDGGGGDRGDPPSENPRRALAQEVRAQVGVLNATFSWKESNRAAAKRATHILAELAKNGKLLAVLPDPPVLIRVSEVVVG